MSFTISASLIRLDGSTGGRPPGVLPKPMRSEKQQMLASERPSINAQSLALSSTSPMSYEHSPPIKIAVIGDVHDHWDDHSAAALSSLNADIAIFVGDFGNEDVDIVKEIASHPAENKLFMLGNHEAWYTLTAKGRQRALKVAMQSSSLTSRNLINSNSPAGSSPALEEMFTLLGNTHIGFSSAIFDQFRVAIVGGRPFSKGGKRWSDISAFYKHHYGIESMQESTHRIVDIALSQPIELPLIVVGHNGPTGLGNKRYSPCGVDWQEPEEDFGDPDLGEAIDTLIAQKRPPALVLFGHMHHMLKNGGKRDMAHVDPTTGIVYLNSAVVPRIRKFPNHHGVKGHHFLVVDMEHGVVSAAKHVWLGVSSVESEVERDTTTTETMSNTTPPCLSINILSEEEVIKSVAAGDESGRRVVSYYKANSDEWTPVVLEGSHPIPPTD